MNQSPKYLRLFVAIFPACVLSLMICGGSLAALGQSRGAHQTQTRTGTGVAPHTGATGPNLGTTNTGATIKNNASLNTGTTTVAPAGVGGTPSPGEGALDTGGSDSPSPSPYFGSSQSTPQLSSSPRSNYSQSSGTPAFEASGSPDSSGDAESTPLPWTWIGLGALVIVIIAIEVANKRSR